MIIIAHRGASADATENTLDAFRLAWQQGADAIETDLRRTADGHVVALHDASLSRIHGVNRRLGDLTLAEIKRAAPLVPTLPEVLATCPLAARVVLELKENLELFPGIAQALTTRPDVQPTFIAFDYDVITATKARFPVHPALWLVDRIPDNLPARLDRANLDGIDLRYSPKLTRKDFDPLAGRTLYTFTVNAPESATHCAQLGIHGLTTDHPAKQSRSGAMGCGCRLSVGRGR